MDNQNINRPWESLDPWQEEVLETKGNIVLRSGRQVGKSTVISIAAGDYALSNRKKTVLVIAAVERQAYLLFNKILNYIDEKYPNQIKGRATMTFVEFKNGSIIRCLPAGLTGEGIRGYTVDLLIADEAAFISEMVWTAVTPMLAITRGRKILLSTPHGRSGYYYDCFKDLTYTSFHISSEDCVRKDQEFLDNEKKRMTKAQYAQEYLGQFTDELRQLFPDELIKKCMKLKRELIVPMKDYYLGVDIARMGEDESTFEIIDRTDKKRLKHVENLVTKKTLTTDTTKLILLLEERYKFKQIFVDDGGMGVGVFDQLLTDPRTRRKVTAINNIDRPLTRDEKKKRRLLKEDIYNNLLNLMERGMIELLDDDEIFLSLKSIQFEYTDRGNLKISGNYAHIADGLVRAAWAVKDKSLNIYIY